MHVHRVIRSTMNKNIPDEIAGGIGKSPLCSYNTKDTIAILLPTQDHVPPIEANMSASHCSNKTSL